jgi:Holliday junction resolvase RusA-like endonuclease
MKIQFLVDGKPIPKARARRGAGGRWITPKRTRAYEKKVSMLAFIHLSASKNRGWPKDARYRVTLEVTFPDRRRRDLDNIAKAILDALNTVAWNDDDQVNELIVNRCEPDKKCPGVVVSVEVLHA